MPNNIDIIVRAKDATAAAWKSVKAGAAAVASGIKKTFSASINFAKQAVVAISAIGAAAVAAGAKAVAAYKEQAAAEAKLEAILKATGFASGFTSGELKKQAAELQKLTGIGDETIISMQGMLASFKQIKGDNFQRATVAILDMGSAMRKTGRGAAEVESASIQVGKALNDPIKGLSALSRVGVTFTDQQKEQIKAMQEAGDIAGAQAIILRELETEFGGTAKAMGDASHGVDQLKAAFGDTIEEIGKAIVETDGFDSVIARITKALQNLSESGYIELWADNIREAIRFITPALESVGKAFGSIKTGIQKAAAFAGALSAGSSISEAKDIANGIPAQLEEEKQIRLRTIREERAEREKIKDDQERSVMASAKLLQVEKDITAEKEKAAKAQEEAAKKRLENVEKLKDAEQKIRDIHQEDINKDNEQRIKDADEAIKKAQGQVAELAKNQQQRRDDRRDEKRKLLAEKAIERAREKIEKGRRVSRRERELVAAADLRGAIAAAQVDKDIARQNLEEAARQKAQATREAQLKELREVKGVIQKSMELA